MANINIALPDILDPVLSYLSRTLPQPLYFFLINVLSHCLALFTALFTLVSSLISTNPLSWDAQTILPPLITVLAAYLALVSFYRTTSWMLRTSIFFIKWGTIIGALMAGAGYFMGNAAGGGGNGVVSGLGGFVLDMINGQGQNAAGGSRRSQRSTRSFDKKKPKAWESFERHREWQYQENDAGADAHTIISEIASAAGKFVRESGWWSVAKTIVEGGMGEQVEAESAKGKGGRKQPPRKQKSKPGNSRSR